MEERELEPYEDGTSEQIEQLLEAEGLILSEEEKEQIVKALTLLLKKIKGEGYPYPYGQYGQAIVTESLDNSRYEKILQKLRRFEPIVKEVWCPPIARSSHELVGHCQEFCRVIDMTDKPGDTVNIPRVRDFSLGSWGTYGSPTLQDETGTDVIDFVQASVQEAGVKFYLKPHLVEKADSNVTQLIEELSRKAVIRAIDSKILSDIASTSSILSIDKSGASSNFDADWIAEIIAEFQGNGVDVQPGDLALFLSPEMYEDLLKDVAGAMSLVFARPDVVQHGRITEFMGVTIRVVSKETLPTSGSNYCAIAFKKQGYTLAIKRNFSIESDPDPANRQTLMVVTCATAGALANPKYGCKIITPVT